MNHIIQNGMAKKLVAHFQSPNDSPPFSAEDLGPLRQFLIEFLQAQGHIANWEIPADQPMHLRILEAMCQIMSDQDIHLFPYLKSGVPTGMDEEIKRSYCFPPAKPKQSPENPLLSVHHCN